MAAQAELGSAVWLRAVTILGIGNMAYVECSGGIALEGDNG